jgi:hypothetical protein
MSASRLLTIAAALVLSVAPARGQTEPTATPAPSGEGWEFSASVWAYLVPEDDDYLQPTFTADRGWLHLEGRYNYEAQDTGSIWLGYNFSGGEELAWWVTPIVAGVFGETDALAAGYEGALGFWRLELYSEGEYVFDGDDGSFFYSWSEVAIAPLDWFRVGLAGQRTRAYQSDRDIQRGLLVGFALGPADLTGYWFNPEDSDPIVILALELSF